MTNLKALSDEARVFGWASGTQDPGLIQEQASELGWQEVAARRGDPFVATLRPTTESQAHPRSLSRQFGLGAQPLHTDGAHMPLPPDFVVLFCKYPSVTTTRLYRPLFSPSNGSGALSPSAARHGMFLVGSGRDSFFSSASNGSSYRFDPGCMAACDTRAHQVAFHFANAFDRATQHSWATRDQVLVIDNNATLHARSALAEGDEERELVRILFRVDSTQ